MNQQALNYMKCEDLHRAQHQLKAAEREVLRIMREYGPHPSVCKLLTITLNNLACYQKKKGLFRSALRYLSQILWIEKFYLKDESYLSSTYVNLSTVLSAIGKHREALKFGKKALSLYISQSSQENEKIKQDQKKTPSNVSLALVICYVNLSTECIHLGLKREAEAFAQQGVERAGRLLQQNHPLIQRLNQLKEMTQSRKKDLPQSVRYPRTTIGDQNKYMRAQSAHTSRLVIDQKEGINLKLDLVRGEVCLDQRGPLVIKKRYCPADSQYYHNVVRPHQGKILPSLSKPFKDMTQKDKNYTLADIAVSGDRARAKSSNPTARNSRTIDKATSGRQQPDHNSQLLHQDLLFENSSTHSPRKKSLDKIDEQSDELAKSRDINVKDVRLDNQ